MSRRRVRSLATIVVLTLAVAAQARAQGNSGKGKGHKSTPPSATVLPAPRGIGPSASPLAWVDDASLLAPGVVSLSISVLRWQGTDLSEVNFPVVDVSAGVLPRLQLGATVPRVVGSADPSGVVGGLGTSYLSAKIGLLTGGRSGVKLAVAPTLEILGDNAVSTSTPGWRRTEFGVPVSAEIDRGVARLFGSAGYFSPGVWFAGGGVGAPIARRAAVSVGFSHARTTDASSTPGRDRTEVSGGAAFSATPQIALFGSLTRTIATTDANGAGTTVGAGVTFTFSPRRGSP